MKYFDWNPVVSALLRILKDAGFRFVFVFDGEDDIVVRDKSIDDISKDITAVDESFLTVSYNGHRAWLHIVLGNDAHEIVADWKINNQIDIQLQNAIDLFEEEWEGRAVPTIDK